MQIARTYNGVTVVGTFRDEYRNLTILRLEDGTSVGLTNEMLMDAFQHEASYRMQWNSSLTVRPARSVVRLGGEGTPLVDRRVARRNSVVLKMGFSGAKNELLAA